MIFVLNSSKDSIYFSPQQTKNLLNVFDELYQLQKQNEKWWYGKINFSKTGKKPWFNKYLMYCHFFNLIRIKTEHVLIQERNIKVFKYKIKDMEKACAMRNFIIESLNTKNKFMKVCCKKLVVLNGIYDEE